MNRVIFEFNDPAQFMHMQAMQNNMITTNQMMMDQQNQMMINELNRQVLQQINRQNDKIQSHIKIYADLPDIKKKETPKSDEEIKKERKELLKKIGVAIAIGTAVYAIGNTLIKANDIIRNNKSLNKLHNDIEKDTKETLKKVDDGINELKDMKKKINSLSQTQDNAMLHAYNRVVDNGMKSFISYKDSMVKSENELKELEKEIKNYSKLNPFTSSRKKIANKMNDINKKGKGITGRNKDIKDKVFLKNPKIIKSELEEDL